MGITIELLINKHIEIWSETDSQKRRIKIQEVYKSNCRIFDPFFSDIVVGHEALSDLIDEVQAKNPGRVFTVTPGSIDEHHDQARFSWNYESPDNPVVITGQDFITVENGLIQSLTVFVDEPTTD
ncbi:nuclear transport factor 2 family protein [Paenibacillus swuensis]|uniref:nuclear transport factor 2 family protein n=1 Tax=Paenibacillus swuensis TaxID=1178515 RepID=UPI000839A967|nr:nuclear transport factor 2 family protein [Paenibacillus swuensis]